LTGTSTTNSITITGATAGTYAVGTIKVAARNDCGTSATSNSASAVTVRSCAAAPATPGAITLGATTVNLNGTFTASITAVSGATSYVWTLPTGLTGTSTTNSITITGATAGTYAVGTIKVAAKNDCGTSATSNSASAVTVRSCPGYFAQGGEYKPGNTAQYLAIPDGTTFATLTNASGSWKFAKTGKDLCFYKTDANNSSTMNWTTAMTGCTSASTTYNDGTTGWRLPNIAELGAIQSIHRSLASQTNSATGTANLRTRDYWSSTEYSSVNAVNWGFSHSYTYRNGKTTVSYVRCVRSY
jgi:hypothetical protein